MKKILILMAVIGMVFTSCGIDGDVGEKMKSPDYPESNSENLGNVENGERSDKVYDDFLNLISSEKKPFELIDFMDKEISNVTSEKADNMILALEEVLNIYESYYQGEIFASDFIKEIGSEFESNEDIVDKAKGTEFESLVEEIVNGGYKFESREGTVYPIVDYSFLKKYDSFISDKVADYINIKSNQSDNPVAMDAALVISWDELGERLLEIESYMDKYNDFVRIKQLEGIYYNYMTIYLAGLDNTPAYDYETDEYKDEVLETIIGIPEMFEFEGTKTADIVKDYLDIIKEDNYVFNQKAKEFIDDLRQKSYDNKINYVYTKGIFAKLLPEKSGYEWRYSGFAEYGHYMEIDEIVRDNGVIKYLITGEVLDMSDGEAGYDSDHYNIDLVYTIENGALIQTKSENMMMDSDFDELELIRAPLTKGNKWGQGVVDESGEYRYLNCEITDINEVEGSKVYTVEYREDSGYYEIRMIEEGIGVVSFTKLWQTDDGDFEIGYSLNKEYSGY
ncbi:hypothetical protein RBH29_13955 [Herbivorax sp. ANBcel31]|uniref:hypothetical protein n=1 Tax=Herbivorax sp. ANBcel31 TaxID=3069754 RepID=UPI0027B034D8|nr:hypothetical protein [Herbivorax sp. ANBcel31]MDQ2087532.1 hypothetical protein [Herbivorax sp. ANBcel31]